MYFWIHTHFSVEGFSLLIMTHNKFPQQQQHAIIYISFTNLHNKLLMQLQLNMQNCINSYHHHHSDKILVFQLKLMQWMCQYLFENAAVENWQRVHFVLCKLHFNTNLFCILWQRPIKSQRSASLSKSHVIWMSFGEIFSSDKFSLWACYCIPFLGYSM